MTPELWKKAEEILDRYRERSPRDLREFLKEQCGDDRELLEIVDSFLRAGESADLHDFLQTPVMELRSPEGRRRRHKKLQQGDRVGSYEIVRLIGRGGMGAVYLARRVDREFDQTVALKVLRPSKQTDEVIHRFRHERQILASFNHPNIAKLLDGGTTDDGLLFFAMELVEGDPIDAYCDRLKLPVSERLRLFRTVCAAVHFAHQNLVVHRDLKPGNILVTADGQPKLLDFGIAKPLDSNSPFGTALTALGIQPMTLAYASPEQVEGRAITTASDVYSLGVIIYLLLTGHRPYRAQKPLDVALAICRDDVESPSSAVLRAVTVKKSGGDVESVTPESVSSRRDGDPRTLRRRLTGDIDSIVLMALNKDPKERYSSVEQFSEDLDNHLAGRPVMARKRTLLYRAGKFIRRNQAAVATAMAALVLIVILAVFYALGLARERDRARRAAAEATQTAEFLRELFEISAPTQAKGEAITARQLLDRGAARIEKDLADQPQLQAEMMTLMGNVYRELALYKKARPLLEHAVGLRREEFGPQRDELAESLYGLARLREDEGEYAAAQTLYEEALAIRELVFGPDDAEVARVLDGFGRVLRLQGAFEQSRRYHERALGIFTAQLGPDHPQVGHSLLGLGTVLQRLRKLEESRARLAQALEIFEREYESDHPQIADTRVLLATALRYTGDPAGARAQYELALPALEQSYGAEHPNVALALDSLGKLLNAMKDHEAAIAYHQRALAIRERAFGPEHTQVASSLNNLGLTYLGREDLAQARVHFERSAQIFEAALGPDHVDFTKPLHSLAQTLISLDELNEAAVLLERVLAVRERVYGPEHSLLTNPLYNLGRLRLRLDDPQAAEPVLRRALALGRDHEPHRHPEVIWPRIYLGRCLTALERFPEAEELLLLNLSEDGIDLRSRRRTREYLVLLYETWERPEEAARHRQTLAAL